MMSQISDEPAAVATPVCVIGPQFVTPNPLEVIVETNSIGSLLVTDVNHKVMLKAKTCNTTFHHQLLLLHADDRPIAMVRHKMMTGHKRWKVYLGDSVAKSDIIFSTQAAHAIQSKTNVHVFLAKNKRKKGKWDFMIKGSWSRRNCTIWMGDSASIIAQMHTMDVPENARFVKDRFMLGVNANVDYAFVVSLIAIVDATKRTSMKNKLIEVVTDGVIEAALGGLAPTSIGPWFDLLMRIEVLAWASRWLVGLCYWTGLATLCDPSCYYQIAMTDSTATSHRVRRGIPKEKV
ncbi:hypothetical protein E3N88_35481 [Mikania micrantha]|uniref:Uncharacterized protein n=1 Tax=Mikania micrantha TaxID=192012 RepID=A0A5N6M1K4_9ASTR|nr:hypothetical protein E3N88_35481 [Mikania micrantha]